jgi:ribonuclease J
MQQLKIIPLGGLTEIGLNCTVFEYGNKAIIVDAGLMFPEENMLGVDIVIPDFSYILENAAKFKAIVVTHAHEDHVGAIPYLLKDLNLPIYATKLTLGLLKKKIEEFKLPGVEYHEIVAKQIFSIGPFTIEPLRVTHSIVDGVALAIRTPVGVVMHSGDFKIDHTPVDGKPFDIDSFCRYGDKGILLLLSDSTNANIPGFTHSEKELEGIFQRIFSQTKGRILAVAFASNVHRVQQIVNVAQQFKKKICLMGRSIVENALIAQELGYLDIPKEMMIKEENIDMYPDDRLVIVTTGSQGEPMSGLSRIALGEHKRIQVKPTDTIVISAKAIPGNQRAIARIVNMLIKRGADVLYEENSNIHVSGHGAQEELKFMLTICKPKYFVPIHGDYIKRSAHAYIARKMGMPPANIFLLDNGDVLVLDKGKTQVSESVNAGRMFVEGRAVGEVGDVVLRDRVRLSTDGACIVFVVLNKVTGDLISGPGIMMKGVTYKSMSCKIVDEASIMLKNLIINQTGRMNILELKKKLRRTMSRFLYKKLMRKPIVLPVVVEV